MHIPPWLWFSITTTVPQFGQFLAWNRFAEGKAAAKLSSAWAGVHKEVLKVPSLRTVIVILAEAPPVWAGSRNKNLIEKVCNNYVIVYGGFDTITPIWD